MRRVRSLYVAALIALTAAVASFPADAAGTALAKDGSFAVGPQYDTTHVYVLAADFERFVASFIATFGGRASTAGVVTVTPEPSLTKSQLVLTPAGTISVFGFETPIPYPFGSEQMGLLLADFDAGVKAAENDGADLVVTPFRDPLGRDAIVRWPGGVTMQLYWHTTAPDYAALATVPESRVYVPPSKADEFVRDYLIFSHGAVVDDDAAAPGIEIGRGGSVYRRIRITSMFGKILVLVTDGILPYPYGREAAGYEVADLAATLQRAVAAHAVVLVQPFDSSGRRSAILEFPGGYIAEIHQAAAP